ncbi:MAG TPA: alpha/beta fold hydrolase [Stellaceae bacterium]|nr:alpha/beta fold hydrolase [Stellaceae bacterium]
MSGTLDHRTITVRGHAVEVAEAGNGPPLLYLHGLADLHAAVPDWLPFQTELHKSFRLVAPALPACAGSDEDEDIETIDELAFRMIETIDALGLDQIDLAGTCAGGWIAAEIAVRHPERVKRLALIAASGLFLPEAPVADLFWHVQPVNGSDFSSLRHLFFGDEGTAQAKAFIPDGRGDPAHEMLRYKTMRFASRFGFHPPYFYDRRLRERLDRYKGPALILWGAEDHLVPPAHAEAYCAGLANATLRMLPGVGHSPHIEAPTVVADALRQFFARP